MKSQIAYLPGDGVGPEVLTEARRVLELCGRLFDRSFNIIEGAIGGNAIDRYDSPLPPPTVELCKNSQAVLLGAVGGPKWDGVPSAKKPERGLLELRTLLGNFANLRPVYVFNPLANGSNVRPEVVRGVDLVFVRELLGGIYFGQPRHRDASRAVDTEVYTVEEVRRVVGRTIADQNDTILIAGRILPALAPATSRAQPTIESGHACAVGSAQRGVHA